MMSMGQTTPQMDRPTEHVERMSTHDQLEGKRYDAEQELAQIAEQINKLETRQAELRVIVEALVPAIKHLEEPPKAMQAAPYGA